MYRYFSLSVSGIRRKRHDRASTSRGSDRHRRVARHRRRGGRAARARRLHRRRQLFRRCRGGRRRWSRKIEAAGGRASPPRPMSATPAPCARMFDAAEAAFGGVDVLVNNAGIMTLAMSPTATTRFRPPGRRQSQGHLQHHARGRQAAARRRPDRQFLDPAWSGSSSRPTAVYAATKAASRRMTASSPRSCAAATSRSTPSRRGRPPPICSSTASRRS